MSELVEPSETHRAEAREARPTSRRVSPTKACSTFGGGAGLITSAAGNRRIPVGRRCVHSRTLFDCCIAAPHQISGVAEAVGLFPNGLQECTVTSTIAETVSTRPLDVLTLTNIRPEGA